MKNKLRREIKAKLHAMSHEDIRAASRCAVEHISQLAEFRDAKVVMLFLSIPGEVDTLPLAKLAWAEGKKVVAPTACYNCRKMRPIECYEDEQHMFQHTHGLRGPAGKDELSVDQIDLVIVPGLAFDRNRNRLGRGGGFYDRFLADKSLRAKTVGIAFDVQIVPEVPVHDNDKPVDRVVTDKEIIE
ncbi:MAG: 5-formyltetrahydrofolate cyclo-ligase [Phycisphaerae bacterium]|nr:5-formyltetrahydrofolate cyclo-ligase [Phycisphaerae bacterium]